MIGEADLRRLDADVGRAIAAGDASGLALLGHGEISIVVGWPAAAPELACKRLPPFPSATAFEAYRELVERYVAGLRGAGVRVLDTEVRSVGRPDGTVTGFHVQPVVPAASLGTAQLAAADPARGHPMVAAVVDTVRRGTTPDHGIDGQLDNWSWIDGEPVQLDLTTPFVLRPDGRPALPMAPFLASLPAAVRPVVRREMAHLITRWTTPRGVLVDLVANLYKTGLDAWVEPVLAEVNGAVAPAVTAAEAHRVHVGDRRLWPLLLRLQKAERWYRHHVRRQPYEFLLPASTTYE